MQEIYMTPEHLRLIILGKIAYRKCPQCDNDAREIQAYDDEGLPCPNDHPEAIHHLCESCGGVAFIPIPG